MTWPWGKKKPEGLEERTSALRTGAVRLEMNQYGSLVEMERDLQYLMSLKEDNRHIADLAKHPGWVEYEAALTKLATRKLRELPRKMREKDTGAEWDAFMIDTINSVLLGLVNNAIYESANLDRLVNNKLTAKARLEEQRND